MPSTSVTHTVLTHGYPDACVPTPRRDNAIESNIGAQYVTAFNASMAAPSIRAYCSASSSNYDATAQFLYSSEAQIVSSVQDAPFNMGLMDTHSSYVTDAFGGGHASTEFPVSTVVAQDIGRTTTLEAHGVPVFSTNLTDTYTSSHRYPSTIPITDAQFPTSTATSGFTCIPVPFIYSPEAQNISSVQSAPSNMLYMNVYSDYATNTFSGGHASTGVPVSIAAPNTRGSMRTFQFGAHVLNIANTYYPASSQFDATSYAASQFLSPEAQNVSSGIASTPTHGTHLNMAPMNVHANNFANTSIDGHVFTQLLAPAATPEVNGSIFSFAAHAVHAPFSWDFTDTYTGAHSSAATSRSVNDGQSFDGSYYSTLTFFPTESPGTLEPPSVADHAAQPSLEPQTPLSPSLTSTPTSSSPASTPKAPSKRHRKGKARAAGAPYAPWESDRLYRIFISPSSNTEFCGRNEFNIKPIHPYMWDILAEDDSCSTPDTRKHRVQGRTFILDFHGGIEGAKSHLATSMEDRRKATQQFPKQDVERRRVLDKRYDYYCFMHGCRQCFTRSERLASHHVLNHQTKKPYLCPYDQCTKEFLKESNLRVHMDAHVASGSPDLPFPYPWNSPYEGMEEAICKSYLKKDKLPQWTGEDTG
ncbi:hypothetical protein M422DRAFT_263748 [Sphaerobolus stellatus SS14]|uniref:C2H2-type domain-containing protein n=1 Tax=Sphaerobolus stellatus (strain SS14) TaxID=990650 RepID=A0A0C9UHA8_SPHS4|nr:hypothetical protein M422DRAFT_263748 [Sphaerobolus stellatus SS14]